MGWGGLRGGLALGSKMKSPALSGGGEVMKQETRPDSESPAAMQPPAPPLWNIPAAEGPRLPRLPSGAALPPRT